MTKVGSGLVAKEHASVAKKIPGSVIRCGPRRMLQYICEKCGSGEPFKAKNGKGLTVPEGKFQCTDKEMMKVLGVEKRRQTMVDFRKAIKDACNGAVSVTHEFKQGCRYPVIVYHVDLPKLKALTPEIVCASHAETVGEGYTEIVLPHTKTDTHTGFSSKTGSPSAPKSGAQTGRPKDGRKPPSPQRSAAQRDATVDALVDSADSYLQVMAEYVASLEEHGYEAPADLVDVNRIMVRLEAEGIPDHEARVLFTEWIPKAKWVREATQGRTDWLADRFESEDKRSLLNQFKSFIAGRKRHEAELDSKFTPEEIEGSVAPQVNNYLSTVQPCCGQIGLECICPCPTCHTPKIECTCEQPKASFDMEVEEA